MKLNEKHFLGFRSPNPSVKTILHELAHTYLDHSEDTPVDKSKKQKKEANDLARKWSKLKDP
jgi:predicted metallopeptidase